MKLGLVIPQSGPSGIFGPSCAASAQLAIEEINASGGILGNEVTSTTIDGGRTPATVATAVANAEVDAVVGWHTSAVRCRLVAALDGRIPYVYTAVYEGGEGADGTFMTGEVPETQVLPALDWMSRELGIARWAVVGSDYVWPRLTVTHMIDRLRDSDAQASVVSASFLPLGCPDFTEVLDRIESSDATGVLVLLLGDDAVRFNQQFAARDLTERCIRLSPLMDENMLMATGAGATHQLYSVSGYFESLATAFSLDFESRYVSRFGAWAPPLTSPGESCYEGMHLLAELTRRAGATGTTSLERAATDPFTYASPRGEVSLTDRHLRQDIYIAAADAMEFDVLAKVSSA
ncbi:MULTISPECIES: substrate-binding domain-containing protein [unclassified Gordonia (in: high G+C Gram-positive bacteria)]|uniref:substrate-binding domain-containing protein n=1 Tax=unclassified Gordonia (in: high G+C Gram-positive bacteria) TaxID=2657482 RepID=UPI001F0F3E01|nr:substrate-binding domain-containing protein [Gordonia sp. ABSL49_1]MCH5645467.1 substrate-binding domain-containing protein [Gordonia sp. ABSL49_1]